MAATISKVLDNNDLLVEILLRLGFHTTLGQAALVYGRWYHHVSDCQFLMCVHASSRCFRHAAREPTRSGSGRPSCFLRNFSPEFRRQWSMNLTIGRTTACQRGWRRQHGSVRLRVWLRPESQPRVEQDCVWRRPCVDVAAAVSLLDSDLGAGEWSEICSGVRPGTDCCY